jgi:hypothetical protein
MILYHFTDFCFLEVGGTILEEGLKPSDGAKHGMLPPVGVVWLTTEKDYQWHERKSSELDHCRIKLAIPSRDRRLVNHSKWLHKHAPEIIETLRRCPCPCDHVGQMNNTWCYFGNVPLFYFRAVEYANPKARAAYEANPDTDCTAGAAA